MKCFVTIAFLFANLLCAAQPKQASLPVYDCGISKVASLLGRQTIVLSPDNAKNLQAIIDEYCGYFGTNCIKRTTSQMQDTDYAKPVFIVGDLRKIKNWTRFRLPVKQLANGFEINNRKFTDSSDGFAFIDTNHIVVSGNSLKAIKEVQLAFTGGYDVTVLQKGKITFFGNYKSNRFDWYDLQDLKKTGYKQRKSALFSNIYLSKTFPDTVDFLITETELKKYKNQFLALYKIPNPTTKIDWFLHANMQEYGMASGMFGLTCPGNNSAGFSIRGEIHTNGYNTDLLKHEYSHYLFDHSIPQDHNPAFFVEGCVEYVTNRNDASLYSQRLAVAKQYRDTLNYEDLIVNNNNFYGQYSAANYSVCGVFVKYIIDRYGVDGFKKHCLAGNKQVATKELFHKDFADFVNGYKTWLDNN